MTTDIDTLKRAAELFGRGSELDSVLAAMEADK